MYHDGRPDVDLVLTTREVIDHPGGVAVVAIDENDNVLTVKQYRYAFQTVLAVCMQFARADLLIKYQPNACEKAGKIL